MYSFENSKYITWFFFFLTTLSVILKWNWFFLLFFFFIFFLLQWEKDGFLFCMDHLPCKVRGSAWQWVSAWQRSIWWQIVQFGSTAWFMLRNLQFSSHCFYYRWQHSRKCTWCFWNNSDLTGHQKALQVSSGFLRPFQNYS